MQFQAVWMKDGSVLGIHVACFPPVCIAHSNSSMYDFVLSRKILRISYHDHAKPLTSKWEPRMASLSARKSE